MEYGLTAREKADISLLYSVKATALSSVLQLMWKRIDGFAVSSLFEARLIRSQFGESQIHYTSPGLRPSEISELSVLCSHISFNSASQAIRHGLAFAKGTSIGIRVNTKIASVSDQRYDPCRPSSKLGIPIEEVADVIESVPFSVEGLHIHTNADSTDFSQLLDNVKALEEAMPENLKFRWINLGGGYLFDRTQLDPLIDACDLARSRFGAEVFVEPGAGLVRSAGFLVASILDIFFVDDCQIAVLDTTVNHMPEVLEFDYQPDVAGHNEDGDFEYTFAGSTCLAGDIFGTYRFSKPLEIGHKIVFEEAGAYTLSKAHRFNGTNLPDIGMLGRDGRYWVCKSFTFPDFVEYWTSNEKPFSRTLASSNCRP